MKRKYDYIFALIRIDPLRHPAWTRRAKKILRRLVRAAALMAFSGDYTHGHGGNIDVDRIAKELIP